ncbi:MAG TPA: efflux RND transporter periplasmic adaptor subunit [Janthinobacterium sp.]|nr:efflux RND transporter periplasmic adaptor subunit [Janthinobacterium sp.]
MSSHEIETPLHRPAPGNLKIKGLVALVVAIGVVGWGITTRAHDSTALVVLKQEQLVPSVKTIQPASQQGTQTLSLPGTLQAYYSATVYARVSGYLKNWSVDIGAPVKAGQVLAAIETPELDQQLKQSEAHLDTALADAHLSEITSKRWQRLLLTDSVSQQEADQKDGENASRKALVAAARADVERLRVLESFKRITSPFDGVVTARKTDIGALINAGHDAGHDLFTVADVHKLRLYVSVPQSYANQIQKGMKAVLDVPEHPGLSFDATLTDDSRAVNELSGTMLIQLEVDNADGKLLPGEYANVRFDLPHDAQAMQLPASVLSFRKEGLAVATLTADNRVAFRSVKISRDLGNTVEIASGLSASDRIIDNPPDGLENGDLVQVGRKAPAAGAKS